MYKRFLNNNDYISIVTEEALQQLIRGNEERLAQAEESAEASIVEYLTDNYEVEKELAIGKSLLPFNRQITYPAGSHFYHEGKIVQAMRPINGLQTPSDVIYWEELVEYEKEKYDRAVPYSQALNWNPGDVVTFANTYFQCVEYNGVDFDDIRIPGLSVWERIVTSEWKPNMPYKLWDVVSFGGIFYTLINIDGIDTTLDPSVSDNWGQIGDYDPMYDYEFSNHEYVVQNGAVYFPVINPKADRLVEGFNIHKDDPRNSNLKKHMLRLAVYELHKLISPNNVSSARISDYEASITWLRDANRCRINPGIPRKIDDEGQHVTEFAIATFARDYDPDKNPWQI